MNKLKKKKQIIKFSKLFARTGFSPIRSGNISIRHNEKNLKGFFITPSGKKNSELKLNDIVFVSLEGEVEKRKRPSSEWRFHLDIYKSRNINAIVHAHSKFSVICSCLYKKIPAFHYMLGITGSDEIKVAKYDLYGTKELSQNILKALEKSLSCLISNHGQISTGENIYNAYELAEEVELLCEYYYYCKLQKNPKKINKLEMKKVLNKILDYKDK